MYPTIDEIRAIPNLRDYKRVSVAWEMLSDFLTPIDADFKIALHTYIFA